MYAGKIENLNTRSPRLLEAADKYQLSELKEICEESLCDNLTVDTCLECLVLADLHNAEELKNASVKFVVEHSEEFVDQVKLIKEKTFESQTLIPPSVRSISLNLIRI